MQPSKFFALKTPWHKKGLLNEPVDTAAEVIRAAGLNWQAVLAPIFYKDGKTERKVTKYSIVKRSDTGDALGVVGARYHPIQNADAFGFFDKFTQDGDATYEACGALFGGRIVWILATLAGRLMVQSDSDVIQASALLLNSHDGQFLTTLRCVPIVARSGVTLSPNIGEISSGVKIRHMRNAGKQTEAQEDIFRGINSFYANLHKKIGILGERLCGNRAFEAYAEFLKLAPKDGAKGKEAKRFAILDELLKRFEAQPEGIRNTWWGALSAVLEYVDFSPLFSRAETEDERIYSILFGVGDQLKSRAFLRAVEMARK